MQSFAVTWGPRWLIKVWKGFLEVDPPPHQPQKERKKKENFLYFYKRKIQQKKRLEEQVNNISRRANEFALDHGLDLTLPAAERLIRWQKKIKGLNRH